MGVQEIVAAAVAVGVGRKRRQLAVGPVAMVSLMTAAALEPIAIMEQALRDAAADAGSASLLSRAGEILVPKGIWSYSDPGRLLADRLGATEARSVLAEIGVSQQTLLTRACQSIAAGEAGVVLVTTCACGKGEGCAPPATKALACGRFDKRPTDTTDFVSTSKSRRMVSDTAILINSYATSPTRITRA